MKTTVVLAAQAFASATLVLACDYHTTHTTAADERNHRGLRQQRLPCAANVDDAAKTNRRADRGRRESRQIIGTQRKTRKKRTPSSLVLGGSREVVASVWASGRRCRGGGALPLGRALMCAYI